MFVIVVGGGNTGSQLAKFLLDAGHTVRVIDERPGILEKLTKELPEGIIIDGDGSSPTVLERAEIHKAQVLAAVTGSDETNLVITLSGGNGSTWPGSHSTSEMPSPSIPVKAMMSPAEASGNSIRSRP